MGNLEKLLVVGVLVVVIAILAISLFWSSDISTIPEMQKDPLATEASGTAAPAVGDLGLPSGAASEPAVGASEPKAPASEPFVPPPSDPPVGTTPSLMTSQPSPAAGPVPGEENFRSYTIKKGDTLETIAQRELGSKSKVAEIQKANEGLDPKKLRVGKTILIPRDAGAPSSLATKSAEEEKPVAAGPSKAGKVSTYIVQKGDTLWEIAKNVYGDGAQWKKIFEANRDKLSNENSLRVGMTLLVP